MSIKRVDVHHHVLTPHYIEELAKVGVVGVGGVPFPTWMPEDSLAVMDRYGTQTTFLSVSAPGLCFGSAAKSRAMARELNEFAADSTQRWPGRFGFFATLPLPNVEDALAEISYALDELHADGIGLLSNYAGVYPGDPRFEPVFAELDRRAALVFIHPTVFTGSEIPMGKNAGSTIPILPGFIGEFVFDTTRAVMNLVLSDTLKRYPNIRIILAHAGGTVPFLANKIVSGALYTAFSQNTPGASSSPKAVATMDQRLHAEVFSQLQRLYYDTALSANPHALSSLLQLVPTSHILWGSDYPFAPEMETRNSVQGIANSTFFNEQDRLNIESSNALSLFPRLQALVNQKGT